jgi:predicted Zn-dependent protease with MMP-like domain
VLENQATVLYGPPGRLGDQERGGYPTSVAEDANTAAEDAEFEQWIEEALESLPSDLHDFMSNVAIVVEEEPPAGRPLLGLYQGVPLTRRGTSYAAVPPDVITIYRGPLIRRYGFDPARLREETRRVVLHEVAHHFGISDERLHELGWD